MPYVQVSAVHADGLASLSVVRTLSTVTTKSGSRINCTQPALNGLIAVRRKRANTSNKPFSHTSGPEWMNISRAMVDVTIAFVVSQIAQNLTDVSINAFLKWLCISYSHTYIHLGNKHLVLELSGVFWVSASKELSICTLFSLLWPDTGPLYIYAETFNVMMSPCKWN